MSSPPCGFTTALRKHSRCLFPAAQNRNPPPPASFCCTRSVAFTRCCHGQSKGHLERLLLPERPGMPLVVMNDALRSGALSCLQTDTRDPSCIPISPAEAEEELAWPGCRPSCAVLVSLAGCPRGGLLRPGHLKEASETHGPGKSWVSFARHLWPVLVSLPLPGILFIHFLMDHPSPPPPRNPRAQVDDRISCNGLRWPTLAGGSWGLGGGRCRDGKELGKEAVPSNPSSEAAILGGGARARSLQS